MSESVQHQILNQLCPLIAPPRQVCHLQLLYRGSRDGFTQVAVKECCTGKVGTFCVVQDTDGNVFGGYNSGVLNRGKNVMTHNDGRFLWALVDGEILTYGSEAPPANSHQHHYNRAPPPADCNCFFGFGSSEGTLYSLESGTRGLCIGGDVLNPLDIRMNALTRGGAASAMRTNSAALKEIEIYQVVVPPVAAQISTH